MVVSGSKLEAIYDKGKGRVSHHFPYLEVPVSKSLVGYNPNICHLISRWSNPSILIIDPYELP